MHLLSGPPDGRTYKGRPVDAMEAEGRRLERFRSPVIKNGPMAAPEEETNPIFPGTLDLRMTTSGQKAPIQKLGLVP